MRPRAVAVRVKQNGTGRINKWLQIDFYGLIVSADRVHEWNEKRGWYAVLRGYDDLPVQVAPIPRRLICKQGIRFTDLTGILACVDRQHIFEVREIHRAGDVELDLNLARTEARSTGAAIGRDLMTARSEYD